MPRMQLHAPMLRSRRRLAYLAMKIVRILGILVLALVVLLAGLYLVRAPEPPPAASESARRLAPGPLRVGSADRTFVDRSRPTAANGDFAGAPERTLEATLWYPEGDTGRHPLLVYSHGFMSGREENVPLVELLASHGYVVVSVDYPLTNFFAPGGPQASDVVNQPGDISFVIDRILGWDGNERPFGGTIDSERIGTLGLSLGGLTTMLVSFHPRLRDPRIRAALSIAGLSAFFDERFFANAELPFLMIAGTGDALVDYADNALPIPRKVTRGALLSIEGASHAGFAAVSDGFPNRLLDNPDSIACWALSRNGDHADPFAQLGGPEDGVAQGAKRPTPCRNGAPAEALSAGRQLMITRLAAVAFFESVFAPDPAERASAETFLRETLAHDFPEARYEGPAAGP
jgi:dienelactone hydrolase